jgi:hypothetical protein
MAVYRVVHLISRGMLTCLWNDIALSYRVLPQLGMILEAQLMISWPRNLAARVRACVISVLPADSSSASSSRGARRL